MIAISILLVVLALLGAPLFAIIAAGALISFISMDPALGVAVPIEYSALQKCRYYWQSRYSLSQAIC